MYLRKLTLIVVLIVVSVSVVSGAVILYHPSDPAHVSFNSSIMKPNGTSFVIPPFNISPNTVLVQNFTTSNSGRFNFSVNPAKGASFVSVSDGLWIYIFNESQGAKLVNSFVHKYSDNNFLYSELAKGFAALHLPPNSGSKNTIAEVGLFERNINAEEGSYMIIVVNPSSSVNHVQMNAILSLKD